MKFKPHEYQSKAIEFVIQQACAGLLLDPGLGKTAIMLAALKILKKEKMAKRMLVVTPLRPMYLTWPAEAAKWDEFRDLHVGLLHGPTKGSVLNDDRIDVHVINPEGLQWLFRAVDDPSEYWDILCIDESTRFKHTNTQRFGVLKPQLEKFRRRYILTGSPAPNGLMDLYGQIFILDLGNSLGHYISHFQATYFHQYDGYTWEPNYGAETRIYEKVAPLVLRMSAEDYLDMPELIGACGWDPNPLVRPVILPEQARKVYDRMEQEMIAELTDDTVAAPNAATVSNKCRQIANGGLFGSTLARERGDTKGKYDLHEAKVDAVEELIEEMQGVPALVAYEYEHDLDRLRRRFPRAPVIGGGVGQAQFKAIEAMWNRGQIPVLLAQPQSVAHGLNLQGTRGNIIWHSITWDLEVYEQFTRRLWRQGQKEKVMAHHIVAQGTIDELVIKMLQKKDGTQRAFLRALRENYL